MPILRGEINQVAVTKTRVDFFGPSRRPPPSSSSSGGQGGGGHGEPDEEAAGGSPERSPQSEAVADDLQELSLQPLGVGGPFPCHGARPGSPPLSERKNVLQLKLQQRRTREELVNQGIMPPLKSPAAFHEQRRSLERARTEDYLKRKIRSRPDRSELVRMHILEETIAEPSLQAKQLKLKRARLADDLNEKISQRPGPMELVEKNIIPVETILKEVIIDVDYAKDSSSFDEDSSDALSPEQPASQESLGSVPSPADSRTSEVLHAPLLSPNQVLSWVQLGVERAEVPPKPERSPAPALSISNGLAAPIPKPLPTLVKHSQPKSSSEKSQRSKKAKESRPKVKKLKYHQYIPPDQKQKGTPSMDSSYAKILQQQQLFLQLQILNQQQHQHYNYQTILPAPPKPMPDQQAVSSTGAPAVRSVPTISLTTTPTPAVSRQNSNMANGGKTGPLPSNLEDMKVAELKQELKQRGRPVSGTKVDLIERLKASQDPSIVGTAPAKPTPMQQPKPNEPVPAFPNHRLCAESIKLGSSSSTPPASPCPSELSMVSMDEASTAGDAFGETVSSPLTQLSLQTSPVQGKEKPSAEGRDKDYMLQEKDRQIEDLTRRLRQKQELVERLRQQLEQEKRTPQRQPPDDQQIVRVKEEPGFISCDSPRNVEALSPLVKHEPKANVTCQQEPQLFLGSVPNGSNGNAADSAGTRLVFTVASPTAQLPDGNRHVVLQRMNTTPSPLHFSNGPQKQQTLITQPAPPSQKPSLQLVAGTVPGSLLSFSAPPNLQPLFNMNGFHKRPSNPGREGSPSCAQKQNPAQPVSTTPPPSQPEPEPPPHSIFLTPSPQARTKEPPGYEEAVRQQPNHSEGPGCQCQQMEDLFDILIQNLDISTEFKEFLVPCIKQTSPTHPVPHTEMPSPIHTMPGRLEDFLESSTGVPLLRGYQDGTTSMPLIDDLHSQMLSSSAILDHSPSPMDTSDLHFSPEGDPLGLDLSDPPLDGMDWLELTGPPAMSLAPLSTATPSVFSTDFLDSHDLQLHWDACL